LADIPLHLLNNLTNDTEKCAALLTSLSKKKDLYKELKLGKTMVFYRPDVHNSLERDKLAVGLRAILSLQSAQRRRKATERVQILWEARRNLRMTMSSGYEDQSSNINAISDLEYWIYYCHQVGLYCFDVTQAQLLLERLQAVKLCLEQLQYLLANGPTLYQQDVTLEFTALEDAIKQAEHLQIIHSVLTQVISRRDDLSGRATAVLALREAILYYDEISLEVCVENVDKLVHEFGHFCDSERDQAFDLLSRLKLELSVLNDVYAALCDSQRNLITAIEVETGDVIEMEDDETTKKILSSSLTTLSQILQPITPEKGYQHPLTTQPSDNIFKLVNLIMSIRANWISSDWKQIADFGIQISRDMKSLWPSDCPVTSEALQNLSQLYLRVIESETQLIAQGVDVHVVLPMLNEGIMTGGIAINPNDISLVTVDVGPLQTAVEKVRQIGTVGEKAKALLEFVESVLSLRRATADDNYEMVLALTESSPITSCRHMRQKKLHTFILGTFTRKKLHKQSSVGFSLQELQDNGDTDHETDEHSDARKPLSNFPLTDLSLLNDEERLYETMIIEKTQILSGPFLSGIGLIQAEIKQARKNALDKYIQVSFPVVELPHHRFVQGYADQRTGNTSNNERSQRLDSTSLGLQLTI
jgi:hypothetical protein